MHHHAQLSCYAIFFSMMAFNVTSKPWFWGPRTEFYTDGWPEIQHDMWVGHMTYCFFFLAKADFVLHFARRHVVNLLCTIELSFYASGFILLFFEVPRKDRVVMGVHHLVTMGLIVLSLLGNFTRIGSFVMLLHDVNDIVLEAGKICNYLDRTNIANSIFLLFVICWFALRIVAFPAVILRNTMFEYLVAVGEESSFILSFHSFDTNSSPCTPLPACATWLIVARTCFVGPILVEKHLPYYYIANGLLLILYCMHIYWFGFIVEGVWR